MIRIKEIYFIILFIFMNFQVIGITGIVKDQVSSNIKLYHVLSLLYPLIFITFKKKYFKFHFYMTLFIVNAILLSIINLLRYPFNYILLNYIYAIYSYFIGFTLIYELGYERIIKLIKISFVIMLISVFIKNVIYINEIIINSILSGLRPLDATFTFWGSGLNLEGTWITILSSVFITSSSFLFFWVLNLIISIIYTSRTTTIIVFFQLIVFLIINKFSLKSYLKGIVLLFSLLLVLSHIPFIDEVTNFAFGRFTRLVDDENIDAASSGRTVLWEYGIKLIKDNPWGVGAGNAVNAIYHDYREDLFDIATNLHNLTLQTIADFGFHGLLFFWILMYIPIKDIFKKNIFSIMLFLLLVSSFFQFRGGEANFWIILGFYFGNYYREKNENKFNFSYH